MKIAISLLFALSILTGCYSVNDTENYFMHNETILAALDNIEDNSDLYYMEFERMNAADPEKMGNVFNAASKINSKTREIINIIEIINQKLLLESGNKKAVELIGNEQVIDYDKITDLSNTHYCEQVLFDNNNGIELRKKILEYLIFIKGLFNNLHTHNYYDELYSEIESVLGIDNIENWIENRFKDKTLLEVLVVLNKIRLEMKIAENYALKALIGTVSGPDYCPNSVKVHFDSEKDFAKVGEEYKASIKLVAYDSLAVPYVYIGDYDHTYQLIGKEDVDWYRLKQTHKGGGIFKKTYVEPGTDTIKGYVLINTPTGPKFFPFKQEITIVE